MELAIRAPSPTSYCTGPFCVEYGYAVCVGALQSARELPYLLLQYYKFHVYSSSK
jgi:hypothetical protein